MNGIYGYIGHPERSETFQSPLEDMLGLSTTSVAERATRLSTAGAPSPSNTAWFP